MCGKAVIGERSVVDMHVFSINKQGSYLVPERHKYKNEDLSRLW